MNYTAGLSFFIPNDLTWRKDKFLDVLDDVDQIVYDDVYNDGEDWCIDCTAKISCETTGDPVDAITNVINSLLPDDCPYWDFHYIDGSDGFHWRP